jgi:hypothetical protein
MAGVRLDHVSYAAGPDGLASTVQRLGSQLGAGFSDGGIHPRFGTRNFILPLSGGTYVEVVGVLDHPAADTAPFGRAVKARTEAGGGWLGWVVGVDDIAPAEQRLGRTAVPGNRRRPDGHELRWKQLGVVGTMDDPQLPFYIQWLADPSDHPGRPGGQLSIERMQLAGDPAVIAAWLGEPADHPLEDVDVDWVDPSDGETGIVSVQFATPHGSVRVD